MYINNVTSSDVHSFSKRISVIDCTSQLSPIKTVPSSQMVSTGVVSVHPVSNIINNKTSVIFLCIYLIMTSVYLYKYYNSFIMLILILKTAIGYNKLLNELIVTINIELWEENMNKNRVS